MYWAEAMAKNVVDQALADKFSGAAAALTENEATIVSELNAAQGSAVDIGGYYQPDSELVEKALRPSGTLNAIIDSI